MATKKITRISNVKNLESDSAKSLGHVKTYDGIYEAIVISAADIQKNGRLTVRLIGANVNVDFLPDSFDVNETHLNLTVRWSSPFAGATNINNNIAPGEIVTPHLNTDPSKTYSGSQRSYGMWMIPPDVGNKVLVMFVGGDISRGVVVGCLYQHLMNHMVPGIARSGTFTSNDEESKDCPVTEYNKLSEIADDVDWTKERKSTSEPESGIKRPTHTPHFEGLREQGLESDTNRGLTSSSARRETPSKVFGILTPDANQFVMDDGDQQLIRLRTKSGAQILLDESNGNVYIINKKGSGYVEIDNDGKIDVWANDSISVRSQKDINFRADRDFNIESGRHINIKAHKTSDSGQPSDTTNILTSVEGNLNLDVEGSVNIKTGNNTKITSGSDFHLSTTGANHFTASASTNIKSGGDHIETATNVHMNGPEAAGASNYGGLTVKANAKGELYFTNTLYTRSPDTDTRNTERVGTILTRFPSREPYAREEYTS